MSLLAKLKNLSSRRRRALEQDMQEEMDSLAALAEADGDRAHLGNLTRAAEEGRSVWTWAWLDQITADIKYALRSIRRGPGFAAMVLLTLAMGIGATTAVFTLVDSVLLKPLTYSDSGQLVVAWEHVRFLGENAVGPNPRHVNVWQNQATAFSALTLFRHASMGLSTGADRPKLTGTVSCLPNLFDVLQVRPLLGRTFLPQDGVKGRDNVAVLTYSLWERVFNGDPGVIGRTIRIDENPIEVIGVLPPDFHFPTANALRSFPSRQAKAGLPEPGIFLPAFFDFADVPWNGNYGNWITVGRLKPGISPEQAESQLNTILYQLAVDAMRVPRDQAARALRASVQPMQEAIVGATSAALWFLMAAVLGFMLIACLNLANAQLGRSLARRRDMALRTALGASKRRLLWSSVVESLVLAVIGGTAGVLLASGALSLIRRYSPIDLPRLAEVQLNVNVLLFAAVLAISASLLAALLPAVKMLRVDPQALLQGSTSRTTFGSSSEGRLRVFLIGLQVFGCTALLFVTGLFTKSLLVLLNQDKGFESRDAAIAEVKLPLKLYNDPQSRVEFVDRVLESLRALSGVEAAGLVSATPLEGESWIEPLRRVDRPEMDGTLVNGRWVSPGYFEATRQKLIAGRFFEERDRQLDSAVLSEGAAQALWKDSSPIGSEVQILGRKHTVIGVVADSRMTSLKSEPVKTAYVHYHYRPPMSTSFVVRSAGGAETLIAGMREAIWKAAPSVTISRVKTFDSQLADSVARERVQMQVLMSFAGAALFLAMLGIYGVLSYSVTSRRQEIGVRMAVGATKAKVYAMTLSQAGVPVVIGLIAGLTVTALAARAIRKFLHGVEIVDPLVMGVVAGLFVFAAAAAAFLPARRAASVDPMQALRAD